MRIRSVLCIALVAGIASVGGSIAAEAVTGGGQPATPRSAVRAAALAPVDTSTEAKFTAITPCRLVDTRNGGGIVAAGLPRTFTATSADLSAQGGRAGGCDIPSASTAIQANVVAVGAAGSGFLTVYPHGVTPPLASYLNFRDGRAIANGGVITLDAVNDQGFTVSTSRSSHVVVDVTGYFVPPMWARVTGDGVLVRGSRVTGVTLVKTGAYQVDFDRDVSHCLFHVTPVGANVFVRAAPRLADATGVFVYFEDSSQSAANTNFFLSVTC
jgi:hypothetical protein